MRDDGRLDGHQQILLLPGVLKDDCKSVVDCAVNAPVRAEEPRHRGGTTKEVQSLVQRMRACSHIRW